MGAPDPHSPLAMELYFLEKIRIYRAEAEQEIESSRRKMERACAELEDTRAELEKRKTEIEAVKEECGAAYANSIDAQSTVRELKLKIKELSIKNEMYKKRFRDGRAPNASGMQHAREAVDE